MNNTALLEYCMSKPGAEQSEHAQWQADQIKVGDVMFAMVSEVQGRPAISLKASLEDAQQLREQYKEIIPSEYLNTAHWNTVFLDGKLPNSQFYSLIDSSYQLIWQGLSVQARQEIKT